MAKIGGIGGGERTEKGGRNKLWEQKEKGEAVKVNAENAEQVK